MISCWNIYVPQSVLFFSQLIAGAMIVVKLSCCSHLMSISAQTSFTLIPTEVAASPWHVTVRQLYSSRLDAAEHDHMRGLMLSAEGL